MTAPTVAQRVLITGTTTGIGRALLEHYVSQGALVTAVNRREVPELAQQFPTVSFRCVDVRARQDVSELIQELEVSGLLPELFILNAGINRVDNDETFELSAFKEVLDTNLYGVLNFIEPLTRLPVGTQRRVIAVGSLASHVGNPYGLGYHVSKRALAACFRVWSKMYARTDLTFQQVLLGPVSTPIYTMSAELPSWMATVRDLASVPARAAAEAIARLATTPCATLVYPRRAVPLYLGMAFCQRFVPGLFDGRKTLRGRARRQPSPR